MKNEKPILFRGEMVRAILDGRKTQTRRVIKPQPELRANVSVLWWKNDMLVPESTYRSPYGAPGDRLWVRETWGIFDTEADGEAYAVAYRADDFGGVVGDCKWIEPPKEQQGKYCKVVDESGWPYCLADERWRSPRFMPRWASRITLEVVSVRVERVQDISEEHARAEGAEPYDIDRIPESDRFLLDAPCMDEGTPHRNGFALLWDSINATRGYSWASNPWVWCVEFRRIAP